MAAFEEFVHVEHLRQLYRSNNLPASYAAFTQFAPEPTIFAPVDQEGQPIPPAELALMIALHKRRPAHEWLFIRGLNGVRRHLEVVAIPILGIQGEFLGAVALFWELGQ